METSYLYKRNKCRFKKGYHLVHQIGENKNPNKVKINHNHPNRPLMIREI